VLIPTLETARLKLVPPSAAGESAYQAFYTDAEASHHYGGPLTASQALARLATDQENWQRQGFGVWAVLLKESDAVVGTCGFWQGKGWPRELTWWLLPEARGRGLAVEASYAAIGHAYRVFGWPDVQTYMNDNNAVARALALRLGGQFMGRQSFPDGLERDVFHLPPPTAA
jgi:[ribosomal protein S5]-alanine N-acetyltransferase